MFFSSNKLFSSWGRTLVLVLAISTVSCGSEAGPSSDDDDDSTTLEATLSSIQTNIFMGTCATAGCHSSSSAAGSLSLAAGESFGELVGILSSGLSTMSLVEASDTTNSYLIHKLEGTQASVGGSGSTMPLGKSSLTTAQLDAIKEWITSGALDN